MPRYCLLMSVAGTVFSPWIYFGVVSVPSVFSLTVKHCLLTTLPSTSSFLV